MMGWLRRCWVFLRAIIQHAFKGKDTEVALARMQEEIDGQLGEARADLCACDEQARKFAALRLDAERQAERAKGQARRALQEGQEELAREAMARHLQATRQVEQYAALCRQQQAGTARLRALLHALETKRADITLQQEALYSRRQVARTQRSLLETLYHARAEPLLEQASVDIRADELTAATYETLVADQQVIGEDTITTLPSTYQVDQALGDLRREIGQASPPRIDST